MTWVAAGIGLGTQAVIGGAQYFANKKRIAKEEANRVKYKIPDEAYQNQAQAKNFAGQISQIGLPQQVLNEAEKNKQRQMAGNMYNLSSRKAGISGVAAENQGYNDFESNLAAQNAQAMLANRQYGYGITNQANTQMADYKNMAFSQEKNAQDVYNAKVNANVGALTQNLMGAAGTFAGIKIPTKAPITTPPAAGAAQGTNPYANNTGSFMNGGQNMFQQPQANPYQAPPLQFGNTPYSGQGYNPWTANTQPFHLNQ